MYKQLTCGIYALLNNGIIYYIGQSKKIEIRVKQHSNYQKPYINHIVIEECSIIELNTRERYWTEYYTSRGIQLTNKYKNVGRKPPKKRTY